MKKIKSFLRSNNKRLMLSVAIFLVVLMITSCPNAVLSLVKPTEKFGSLTVLPMDGGRAIQIDKISLAEVSITGYGMTEISKDVGVLGGKNDGTVTIENIPVGKNRIVTVKAKTVDDGTPEFIDGFVMRAVTDISLGNNSVYVNWLSTGLGNVFNDLLDKGTDISKISEADKTEIETFVENTRGSDHPSLLDTEAIADGYKASGTGGLTSPETKKITPAKLTFTSNYNSTKFKVRVEDPSSRLSTGINNGLNTVDNITPGTWRVMVYYGLAVLYDKNETFVSGQTKSLGSINFVVPNPTITPASTNISGSQKITISSTSDHNVDIYYTTNGITPTTSSTKYVAPFNITPGIVTVKAIAYGRGDFSELKESSVVEQTYNCTSVGELHPTVGAYSPVNQNTWGSGNWKLGAHKDGSSTTFALYSKNATKVLLEIYETKNGVNAKYDYWMTKGSDNIWRAKIASVPTGALYAFRLWGPNWQWDYTWDRGNSSAGFISDVDNNGNRFNPNKVVFDPYARELTHDKSNPSVLTGGHDAGMYGTGGDDYKGVARRNFDTGKFSPKSVYVVDSTSSGIKPNIDPQDAIIYEAHPRGLTMHSSTASLESILNGFNGFENVVNVPAAYRGTYKGAGYMAKYLKALGVTTIELLPVHETDNDGNPDDGPGGNYWGYMTFGYFAPDRRYSSDKTPGGPTKEFKEMVKAFHDEGLEVYLDVVYNHSGEGGTWHGDEDGFEAADILFLRGIDNSEYYALVPGEKGAYWETTGCGNNLRCDNPVVRNLILDSLKYWVEEMGVDGFRFDLAPVLGRVQEDDSWNFHQQAQTLTDIASYGIDQNVEMIAEAWDIGTYQVGWFPNGWGDWNGRFRDATRGYMQTGFGVHDGLSYTDGFHGTYDRYYRDGVGGPHYSINFIVAHDGLTLADLVSYPGTGNARNGTLGWPFGPSDGGNGDDNVISFDGYDNKHLRRQTIRNYFTWLMFARGVPMIVYGDEFGRTQNGNNNPYNIDSVATWNNYNMINTDSPQAVATGDGGAYDNNLGTDDSADNINDLFVFASKVMNLRQNSKALRQNNYNMTIDYAKEDGSGDFNSNSDRCVRIHIKGSEVGDVDYLIMSNMWEEMIQFNIPAAANGKQWVRIIDTAAWAEGEDYKNFWDDADADGIENSYGVNPWSIVVLKEVGGSSGGVGFDFNW